MTTCSGIHEKIKEQVKKNQPKRIIELGAGVGSVTEHILDAMPEKGELLCIEQEKKFCDQLGSRFEDRVTVINGDALELLELVQDTPWEQADAVISTVPLIIDDADALCEQIREVLTDQGLYLQVANLPGPMKKQFRIKNSWFFPTNIPPERLHLADNSGNPTGQPLDSEGVSLD